MTAVPTLKKLRDRHREISELARRRGVTSIKVFGSVARAEARPDSDVDLLVELEDGRSILDLGGFLDEVSELLGRPVHVVTPRTQLGARVGGEAVPL